MFVASPRKVPLSSKRWRLVTLEKLDNIVWREPSTNMKNSNTCALMQDLLSNYQTILSRSGLKWIRSDNQKVEIEHVLHAIELASLLQRLEFDRAFSYHPIRKLFKEFLKRSFKFAACINIGNYGPPSKRRVNKSRHRGSHLWNNNSNNTNNRNGS